MKKIIQIVRSNPARVFLILFLLLIIPALILYPLAEAGNQAGMGITLALIILANVAVVIT
jgi:hypothetical protein